MCVWFIGAATTNFPFGINKVYIYLSISIFSKSAFVVIRSRLTRVIEMELTAD